MIYRIITYKDGRKELAKFPSNQDKILWAIRNHILVDWKNNPPGYITKAEYDTLTVFGGFSKRFVV